MTIQDVRVLLGPEAEGKSDEEIDRIRVAVARFAEILVNRWREQLARRRA